MLVELISGVGLGVVLDSPLSDLPESGRIAISSPPAPPVAEAAAANVDIRDSLKQWASSAKTERYRGCAGDVSPFLPG